MQQEFVFKYMTAKNVVTIDQYGINCKIGPIIKKNALLSNVQHIMCSTISNTGTSCSPSPTKAAK